MKKRAQAMFVLGGTTILAILAILFFLSACVIGALTYTMSLSRNVVRTNALRRATEVGDGVLDYMFSYWRELSKEQPSSLLSTSAFSSIAQPTQAMFPTIPNFTVSTGPNPTSGTPYTVANYQVQATDPQMIPMSSTTASPTVGTGMNVGSKSAFYLASADISVPGFGNKMLTVKMRRVFQKQYQSPWEYAIFYNDLLEMHPGAPQTITGWVHTNGSLYTAMSDLTFNSKVDYGNDWGIAWAPGDRDHPPATPASPTWPSNLPPARGQVQLPFGLDPTQIFTNTNANNSGYIELIQPPVSGQPDPIASSRYYDQAQVRVLVDANNNVTLSDINGTVLTSSNCTPANNSSTTALQKAIYNTFITNGAIITNDSIQDNREQATMRIVTFDVSKFNSAASTLPGVNIVYIADTSGSATVKRGVRLKNGATIPSGGLTVCSQNPVYIQGDFNTGQTSSTQTPANVNNNGTGANTVAGYQWQPCAVLGDAINILSNAWQDSNSTGALSARVASPTTVNAAIVSGIVPTGTAPSSASAANSYSGGEENFPRFLEDWSGGKTFSYYGSMVEVFQSQQSIGYWGNSNVYNPPNRSWHFDSNFYSTPPPGTFLIITYIKQRWFTI